MSLLRFAQDTQLTCQHKMHAAEAVRISVWGEIDR